MQILLLDVDLIVCNQTEFSNSNDVLIESSGIYIYIGHVVYTQG